MWDDGYRMQMLYMGMDGRPFRGDGKSYEGEVAQSMETIKKSATKFEVKVPESNLRSERLKALGFNKLHDETKRRVDVATKQSIISLRGYTRITREQFDKANNDLKSKSGYNKELALTKVSDYLGQNIDNRGSFSVDEVSLPPDSVLEKMEVAKKENLFDDFAIIHVVKSVDPILVGTISGDTNLYFIDEWGNDISLKEIVG